jgi:hypothetical protein
MMFCIVKYDGYVTYYVRAFYVGGQYKIITTG